MHLPSLTPRHEAFALAVSEGLSGSAAYQKVYPKAKPSTCETRGPMLLRQSNIATRVDELKAKSAQIAEEEFGYTRASVIGYLLEVMNTPAGDVNKSHRLCQEYTDEVSEHGARHRIKMPAKLEAVEKLIRMAGWNTPEKVHLGADDELRESLAQALSAVIK